MPRLRGLWPTPVLYVSRKSKIIPYNLFQICSDSKFIQSSNRRSAFFTSYKKNSILNRFKSLLKIWVCF